MARIGFGRWATLAGLLAGVILISGCTLDQQKYAAAMAEYAGRPDNKAMYFDTLSWSQFWTWSRPSPEDAVGTAKTT